MTKTEFNGRLSEALDEIQKIVDMSDEVCLEYLKNFIKEWEANNDK